MLSDDSGPQVVDYAEVLRRRWIIVVTGLVVGVLLAVALVTLVPKSYTSTASVIVSSTGEDMSVANGRTTTDLNMDTEAQIVTSGGVASDAQKRIGTTAPTRELVKQVQITVPPNTSVLDISFTAPTAREAQVGAGSFASAYLDNRGKLAEAGADDQAALLRTRLTTLNDQLRSTGLRIVAPSVSAAERSYLTSQRSLLVRQIATLNDQLAALTPERISPGSVLNAAELPTRPSDPSTTLLVASALLIGLLLGLLGALLRDRVDGRVRDRRDLSRAGLAPLTRRVTVPAARDIGAGGPDTESVRQMRNALLAALPDQGGSALIASASPGAAGTAVAVGLAAAIARTGSSVILVSASSEGGAAAQALGVADQAGLSQLLTGRRRLDRTLRKVKDLPALRVLAAGAEGQALSDVVQGAGVRELLTRLEETADYVLVDVAPMALSADAQSLASATRAVLVVAEARRTTRAELRDAVDQLGCVSAAVVGAVVVDVARLTDKTLAADAEATRTTEGPLEQVPVDRSGADRAASGPDDGLWDADEDVDDDDTDRPAAGIGRRT